MSRQHDPATTPDTVSSIGLLSTFVRTALAVVLLVGVGAVEPVLAQTGASGTNAFCQTNMAETIRNLFRLIQFGGPLIGGLVALAATVSLPLTRRTDFKRELKETRNQALLWGVIVAPLGTTFLGFLLTNIVAGGASCSF